MTVISAETVYIVDGKKCDKEALNKIKPAEIASMAVYKPGSKDAAQTMTATPPPLATSMR